MASPTESTPTKESSSAQEPSSVAGLSHAGDPTTTATPAARPVQHTAGVDAGVGFDHLLELFQEVIGARAALTIARRAPLGRSRLVDAPRARLLLALEAYAAELQSRNLPVPYAIRDDLRIQRRILGRSAGASGK
jgi:hypothetical protein